MGIWSGPDHAGAAAVTLLVRVRDRHTAVRSGHHPAAPEARHQRFFETWTQTLADSAFDQQHYTFASNSLAACLDYVEHTDAVINHTDVMAKEFQRRGLHRLSLTDPARKRTVGIYALTERMGEQRTMETIALLKQAAATVLPL